jgi:excisionase family DNA binding protein
MKKATPLRIPEYFTVKEAAELLRLSEVTIRRLLWKKKIKRYRAGGRTLLLKTDVLAQIKLVS